MSVIEFHRSHSDEDVATVRDDAEVESTSPAPRSSVEFVRSRPPSGDTRTARGLEDGNSATAFVLPVIYALPDESTAMLVPNVSAPPPR